MKKIGLIPSRLNSSRLHQKALKDIGGLPMFAHVYLRALQASLDEVYLLTDSHEIEEVAKHYNFNVLMTDPNHKNGTERCFEGAKILNLNDEDIIVDIQGDEPLINPSDISNILNFFSKNKHEIVVSIINTNSFNNENTVKVAKTQDNKIIYLSRKDIPSNSKSLYITKGLVAFNFKSLEKYISTDETELEILEKHELQRCCENNFEIYGFEINYDSRAVDIEDDLEWVRQKIKKDPIFQNYSKLKPVK